ncbi:MAG TPA: hypothetical protein VE129_19420 [Thermoanaerobaculia bacterium]|nr:hypothetical protein [Thermoanaerobaculia bacterium]
MRALSTMLLRAGATAHRLAPAAAILLVVLSTGILGDALVERFAARRAAR